MSVVTIHGREFELFLSEEQIQSAIKQVASDLTDEYKDKCPLFIGVLNGCFRFAADLMKYMEFESEVSFVKLASYRGTESTGKVSDLITLNTDLRGKDVVVLEDIVDTGHTMEYLLGRIAERSPASVKVASLLFKPECFEGTRKPDFQGFEIPNLFVVGYGLDYDGLGRNLNDIYQIKS